MFVGVGPIPGLTVQDASGNTIVTGVTRIEVTDGTITDDGGGVVSIDTGGGTGETAFQVVSSLPGTADAGAAYLRTSDDTFWGVSPADTFNQLWSANKTASVAGGGTGLSSTTAYAIMAGGTTSTGALQQVSGVGTSGQVLTSNGAAALPTWQAGGSGTTINATNGVLPYRSSSTVFLDSPLSVATGRLVSTATATSSGVVPYLRIVTPADTAQTLDTEFTGMFFGGDASGATVVRQTADGSTIAIQRESRFIGPTYTAVGATVLTDAFTVGMTPPVQSTNITITRNHTLGILDATSAASSTTGGLVVATAFGTAATSVGIGAGNVNAGTAVTVGNSAMDSTNGFGAANSSTAGFYWTGRSQILSPSNGEVRLANGGGTGFTRLDFSSATANGCAIGFDAVNGFTLQSGAGTTTWNDNSTASSGTVANRYMFGIAGPTLTATNTTVTNTVASTVYIGDAPTDSTNTTSTAKYALNVNAGLVRIGGLGSDATHTDSTVCQDTTTHALYAGSGAAGICLGTSSARFKESVSDIKEGLAEVLRLRPRNFRYKKGIVDSGERMQYGLVAEEVEAVIPSIVAKGKNGEINSVDYGTLFAIYAKAFQDLHEKFDAYVELVNARLETVAG